MSAFQDTVTRKLTEHDERFDRIDRRFDWLETEVSRLGVMMEDRDRKIDLIFEVCLGFQSVSDGLKTVDRRLDGHEVRLRALEADSRRRKTREDKSK